MISWARRAVAIDPVVALSASRGGRRRDARMDESVHVLMLTGAGDKFFCAGADIGMLEKSNPYFKYNGAL